MSREATLAASLADVETVTIVCHDNPDPDCLASALALDHIARSVDVSETRIVYGGEISHQQNRAFVNMLDIDVYHDDPIDEDTFVAFVDHSRRDGTTSLGDVTPDAVIDHHPEYDIDAPFVDVRT